MSHCFQGVLPYVELVWFTLGRAAHRDNLGNDGLKGVELIVSDACRGLVESIDEFLPDARWQRCLGMASCPVSRGPVSMSEVM